MTLYQDLHTGEVTTDHARAVLVFFAELRHNVKAYETDEHGNETRALLWEH